MTIGLECVAIKNMKTGRETKRDIEMVLHKLKSYFLAVGIILFQPLMSIYCENN
jgi:hypothetical protein